MALPLAAAFAELTLEEFGALSLVEQEELTAAAIDAADEEFIVENPTIQRSRRPFYQTPPRPTRGQVIRGAVGVGNLAGALALPAIINSFKTPEQPRTSRISQFTAPRSMHRRINTGGRNARAPRTASAVPYFSFANSTRGRTMPALGKRKRSKRYRRPLPRRVRPRLGRTRSSHVANGPSRSQKITVVNKLFKGKAPTNATAGNSLTDVMTNIGSRTTPDGTFAVSYSWSLTDFPNYADYIDIYQWYKILFVKVHYYPLNNSYPGLIESSATNPIEGLISTGGTNYRSCAAPSVVFAKDDAGASAFTTEEIAMQHAGSQYHQFNDGSDLTVFIAPKPTGLLGTAGAEVVYQHKQPQWITTSETGVQHFGLKTFWKMPDGSGVRVIMEMKVAFKEPKM